MLRRCFIILAAFLASALAGAGKSYSVSSPDGNVCLKVELDGELRLSLTFRGEVLLQDSPYVLSTDRGEFGRAFRLRKVVKRHVDERFETPVYKRSTETSIFNEVLLRGKDGYDIVLRASDEGAAWRFVYSAVGIHPQAAASAAPEQSRSA